MHERLRREGSRLVDSLAVWERLRRYLSRPPPGAPPLETLRWVRRLTVAMLPLAALFFVRAWASDAVPLWVAAGVAALMASSPASLTLVIRATESAAASGDYTPPSPEQLRRRERRAAYVTVAVLCISLPVIGYLVDGLGSAALFLVIGIFSSGVAVWSQRRFWGP